MNKIREQIDRLAVLFEDYKAKANGERKEYISIIKNLREENRTLRMKIKKLENERKDSGSKDSCGCRKSND